MLIIDLLLLVGVVFIAWLAYRAGRRSAAQRKTVHVLVLHAVKGIFSSQIVAVYENRKHAETRGKVIASDTWKPEILQVVIK